jgi:hypothetical protein
MLAAIVARLIRAYLSLYRALSGHHVQSASNSRFVRAKGLSE